MADQELEIYASETIIDDVKGNAQKRPIQPEEWLQGILRLGGITNQHWNTLMNLLTHYSPPADTCPYPHKDGVPIPDVALHMNGQAITQAEYPELFKTYGANLPDMTADNLTGFIWVVRKH